MDEIQIKSCPDAIFYFYSLTFRNGMCYKKQGQCYIQVYAHNMVVRLYKPP